MRVITATLFLFLCGWALGDIAPSQQRPVVAKTAPSQKERGAQKARQDHYPTEDAPFPVRVIQAPSDSANSAAQENKTNVREDENAKSQERAAVAAESQARAAWFTAGISLVGAVFLLWTLYETRRTANASRDSVKAMERADRPYAFMRDFGGHVHPHKIAMAVAVSLDGNISPLVRFTISNNGKSPAIVNQVTIGLVLATELSDVPDYSKCVAMEGERIITASEISPWFNQYFPDALPKSPVDEKAIDNGYMGYFLYGVIDYEDASGRQYKTGFCFRVTNDSVEKLQCVGGKAYNYRT